MSWLEAGLGLLGLLLALNAARRGFVREGSLLLGLGVSLWLAGRWYRQVGGAILLAGSGERWRLAVYFALMVLLLVVVVGVSAQLSPLVASGPLRLLDRLAGLFLGATEAALFLGLVLIAGERLAGLRLPHASPLGRAAELAGVGLAWLAGTLPPELIAAAPLH